jgi:hypothetical protein
MKQLVASWCIGIVLLAAIAACASALPTALQTASYENEQLNCIYFADAMAQADTCRAAARAHFCSEYPDSCPSGWMDAGVE